MNLNHIYNMDCVEGMKKLLIENGTDGVIDCVITSPPYNTMRNGQDDVGYDFYKDSIANDKYINWIVDIFNLFDKLLKKNGKVLFNMNYGTENTECMSLTISEILKRTNFTLADIIVWEKKTATPNNVSSNKLTRICEFVYVFCRRSEFHTFTMNKRVVGNMPSGQVVYENIYNKVVADNNDGSCPLNRATFSTELVTNLLEMYCKKNDVILDPFMGTGTTSVSCKKRGNPYIGFELSKDQCNWANNRLCSARTVSALF